MIKISLIFSLDKFFNSNAFFFDRIEFIYFDTWSTGKQVGYDCSILYMRLLTMYRQKLDDRDHHSKISFPILTDDSGSFKFAALLVLKPLQYHFLRVTRLVSTRNNKIL